MLALVIDTSSAAVTAGVVEVGDTTGEVQVLAERVTVDARAHGELLAPGIKAALAEAGVGVAELTAVVAGVGPGPFTGLRVGLVTAASICDVADLPAYDVCSLDAIALAADRADGPLLVAGDARRREVYWAVYRSGVRDHYPAVGRPAALPAEVIATSTAMAGAGARLYAAELGLPLVAPDYPSVLGLAHAAAARVVAGAPGELLTPLYLRRPDAAIPAPRKPVTR